MSPGEASGSPRAEPASAEPGSAAGELERRSRRLRLGDRSTAHERPRAIYAGRRLYAEAQRLDIDGRSSMNKDELRRAVERAR
ncbi:MAG: hypothetical protein WKF31_09055 [Thermoleophilaceae bacterium]